MLYRSDGNCLVEIMNKPEDLHDMSRLFTDYILIPGIHWVHYDCFECCDYP